MRKTRCMIFSMLLWSFVSSSNIMAQEHRMKSDDNGIHALDSKLELTRCKKSPPHRKLMISEPNTPRQCFSCYLHGGSLIMGIADVSAFSR